MPQRRTPWLVIQNERYTPVSAYHTITIEFRALLPPFYGFFSAFPHGTLRYRTQDVFTVRGNCPLNSDTIPNVPYSGYFQRPSSFSLRGYHPLRRSFPGDFASKSEVKRKPYNTTFPRDFARGFSLPSAAFSRPYSRHPNLVSVPPGTKTFQFPGSADLSVSRGSPIRRFPVQRPHAPRRNFSQLVTSFFAA